MPGRGRTQVRNQAVQPAWAPAAGEMPNIVPVGDAGPWIRKFLYSYPGWGKTSLIASGAAEYRTLIIRSSLDQMPTRALHSGAQEVVCDTHESMLQVLDYCRMTKDFPYAWVWWDCASIAQDVLLDDVWAAVIADKPGRNTLTPQGGKDRGEYWKNADRIQMWVRHMVGCRRFHFGMTAHPEWGAHPTNDEGGDLLRPFIQVKNMSEKLCGYCNMVAFLEVLDPENENDEAPRRLHFKETSRFYAKDLYDAFLPSGRLDDPTIPKIMRAVEAARKGQGQGRGRTPAPVTTISRGRGRRA